MSEKASHLRGSSIVDRLVQHVGNTARWLCVGLVLLQFAVVLARYIFDAGSVMAQEAILYLFGTMFMLSIADALAAGRHVRVDMIYHGLSERWKRRIDAVGVIVFLLPLCSFMAYTSWGYVAASWAAREGSREAAGLPGVFLFKTIILISLALLILQALAILVRCLTGKRHD
ncbi:TRAP transporter small permease subunit [Sulfitobacter sp.]|uniref:TRAP transporter small permease subunit n=1 Tax=Sulfitobacter sp. TaxID=1903071 RepID=UPI003002D944